jgi:uncharacterized protein YuzE
MVQASTELKMNYDRAADVLYCSFGDPQPALSVEKDNGIVLRVNPETEQITGITIVNFFKRFADHPNQAVSVSLETEAQAVA